MAPRFKGELVDLGGTEYTVPPLALGAVKDLLPRIQQMRSSASVLPGGEDIDTMIDVLHSAITRNHPEMTKESLLELVDLGNVHLLFQGVMGRSGLVKPPEGSAGNAAAP